MGSPQIKMAGLFMCHVVMSSNVTKWSRDRLTTSFKKSTWNHQIQNIPLRKLVNSTDAPFFTTAEILIHGSISSLPNDPKCLYQTSHTHTHLETRSPQFPDCFTPKQVWAHAKTTNCSINPSMPFPKGPSLLATVNLMQPRLLWPTTCPSPMRYLSRC